MTGERSASQHFNVQAFAGERPERLSERAARLLADPVDFLNLLSAAAG
jgi:hypothetical protein